MHSNCVLVRLTFREDGSQRWQAFNWLPGALLQVAVEAFAGPELDFELLPGKWRLEYTTAADVVGPS